MKKLLWILLASVAVVGCKKNTPEAPDGPSVNNDEIKIGATQGFLSKATVGNDSKFNSSSKIGVFSVIADVSATPVFGTDAFKSPKQGNMPYGFNGQSDDADLSKPSLPWVSLTAGDMLKWQFDAITTTNVVPVYLVAYHPYNPSLIRDATSGEEMEFAIAQDQTTLENYNNSDLMWAASTGKGTDGNYESLKPGYSLAINGKGINKTADLGNNINLEFNHMLTRLNFNLGFYTTAGTNEVFKEPIVKKIEVTGSKITNTGKLNLKTGVYTAAANVAPAVGSSFWADPASATTLAVAVAKGNVVYTEICDVITAPAAFEATATDNILKFTVDYQYSKDNGSTFAPKTKVYTFVLNTVPDPDSAGSYLKDFDFKRNERNNFKVALNLSSDEIYITTTIVEWTPVAHEIEGN